MGSYTTKVLLEIPWETDEGRRGSMRLGMPRDFDELVRFQGAVIATVASPQNVLMVAHHLWYRSILKSFRPPREISRAEVIDYLGLPRAAWDAAALHHPHTLPKPIEGCLEQPESKYRFSDAERCYERRGEFFPQISQLGFFRSVVPGLADFLIVESTRIVEELQLGYIFDVPPDLPQSDEEMLAAYATTVARVVRCRLKFGMDVPDAINEVWLKILKSNLLVKFMRSGAKRLPAQMTTEEAFDYLGVEWPHWYRMVRRHPGAPNPVKGSAVSLAAVYRCEDIRALDESGFFKKRGLRFLPASSVSRELFDKYVATAAEHALKNIFRTLDRRFNREDTLQEGACIHDNRRVRVRRDDLDLAWEDTLSSSSAPPLSGSGVDNIAADVLIDIKRRMVVSQMA